MGQKSWGGAEKAAFGQQRPDGYLKYTPRNGRSRNSDCRSCFWNIADEGGHSWRAEFGGVRVRSFVQKPSDNSQQLS
jgi:hypothetical protein